MGLFKKKPTVDPVDFLALRSEIAVLQERLDQTEQAKAALEDRLSSLAATTMLLSTTAKSDTAEIVEQIESLHGRLDSSPDAASELEALRTRLAELEARPATSAQIPDDLAEQLGDLNERLHHVAALAASPAAPDEELTSRIESLTRSAEALDLVQRQVAQLSARVSAQSEISDQITALTDRISLLQQRSIDSDQINQRLDEIAATAVGTTDLSERLVDIAGRVHAAEQRALAASEHAATLEQRLMSNSDTTASLHRQLDDLMATLESRPAGIPDDVADRLAALDERAEAARAAAEAAQAAAEIAKSQSEAVAERASASMATASEAQRQASVLEQRLQSVSTELANQLSELGQELDGLSSREPAQIAAGGEISDELIDAIRNGQVKLAAEQARYEISFREDLAQLAEQVRQLRGR
jgi:chromosome segregation ATPase